MSLNFKHSLIIITALALFVPIVQFKFEVFDIKPLEGDLTVAKQPEFKQEDYWTLKWQDDYNKYLNDNFGFRSWFVRLNNQLLFSFFNSTKAPGVVIGKNGELFIESYINDHIGRNFIGGSKIKETSIKIKALQDSLKSLNTDLIVVFAPGKASYYPELIPDSYTKKIKDSTNYKVYADQFLKNNINFIDLNKWFSANKENFKHPVYPKYGTHWNHYGMCLALDTILKYIEKKRNIHFPDFNYDLVNYNTNLKGNDYDVGVLMNLLSPLEKDANPYPVYKFSNESSFKKPDVLVVGDSYWWCLVGDDLPIRFFKEDEYWFYNKDQYIRNGKAKPVKKLNLNAALTQRDVILLIATEATYYMFPYGFVDSALETVKAKIKDGLRRKAYLPVLVERIKKTAEWMADIEKKAKTENKSIDEMVLLDAIFIYEAEYCKPEVVAATEEVKTRIINTLAWSEQIKQKAKEKNISFREMLELDAKFIYESEKAAEPKPEKKEITLNDAIESIRKNAQWMKDIKKKALENKVTEEEQIKKDVQWLYEQNKK